MFLWSICVGGLVLVWVTSRIIYSLFISPLKHFPGPRSWATSTIPWNLSVLFGNSHLDFTTLHAKYGPVVRIGPNDLSFATAQAFRDIYGLRPGGCFNKHPRLYTPPANGVDNIVSARDQTLHARHRKLLSPAFSDRAVRDQEDVIRGFADKLITRLREQADVHNKVDIKNWMNYTTFDITGQLIFSDPFTCLDDGRLHPWIELIFTSFKAIVYAGMINTQVPWLQPLLEWIIPASVKQKADDHFNLAVEKVEGRLEMEKEIDKDGSRSGPRDVMSFLLKNGVDGDGGEMAMSRAEMHSNAFVLIIAGSETTATLLSGCIYYLCRTPSSMDLLIHEIRSAFTTDNDITFAETSKLSYLAAVIEESLRMFPPLATMANRTVPKGGAVVDGYYVPENTTVGAQHYASYRSPSNFTLPNDFLPERWLTSDSDTRFASDKKDVLQPFLLGPRGCIGKALAYCEMRLILCKLLFHFDIELCAESAGWSEQKTYFLWDKPPLMVTLKDRLKV